MNKKLSKKELQHLERQEIKKYRLFTLGVIVVIALSFWILWEFSTKGKSHYNNSHIGYINQH